MGVQTQEACLASAPAPRPEPPCLCGGRIWGPRDHGSRGHPPGALAVASPALKPRLRVRRLATAARAARLSTDIRAPSALIREAGAVKERVEYLSDSDKRLLKAVAQQSAGTAEFRSKDVLIVGRIDFG